MIPAGTPFTLAGTSPTTAAGKAVIATLGGLGKYDALIFTCSFAGATGGTLDLVIQRLITTADAAAPLWTDWARFTQIAAAGAAVVYQLSSAQAATTPIVTSIWANDLSTGALTLTTNTCVGGHPGDKIRLVGIPGATTTVGATQTVYVTPFKTFT